MSKTEADSDFEAWKAGDRAAGDRLFNSFYPAIYAFFDRKIPGEVHDLVQATFEGVLSSSSRFRGISSFRAYLYGVARNKLLEYFRLNYRKMGVLVDFSVTSLAALSGSPSSWMEGRQRQRLVLEALRSIALDKQLLIELFYWDGLSGRELAELYGVSDNVLRARLRLAREALARAMTDLVSNPSVIEETVSDLDDYMIKLRDVAAERLPGLGAKKSP